MEPDDARLVSELEQVKTLAAEVAALALSRSGRVEAEEKANLSFVTDLDLEVERLIRDRLSRLFPDDKVTGEEYQAGGGDGPRTWSIDPIDGTGNLVHGLPLWAVSIGLIDEHGAPALGVIAIPPLNEMFWAIRGGGAWRDGHRLHAARDADAFHPHDNVSISTNALRAMDPRTIPGRLRDLGSACTELAFVACGRLTACCFLGEHRHDVTAGAVIVSEAGCRFGTIDGRRLNPSEMVAATPVETPTFIAPPRRLEALIGGAVKRLA